MAVCSINSGNGREMNVCLTINQNYQKNFPSKKNTTEFISAERSSKVISEMYP